MFPEEWFMTERIAVEFCHITRLKTADCGSGFSLLKEKKEVK